MMGVRPLQNLLQKAIWMLEGEMTPVNDNYFYNLATTSSVMHGADMTSAQSAF